MLCKSSASENFDGIRHRVTRIYYKISIAKTVDRVSWSSPVIAITWIHPGTHGKVVITSQPWEIMYWLVSTCTNYIPVFASFLNYFHSKEMLPIAVTAGRAGHDGLSLT